MAADWSPSARDDLRGGQIDRCEIGGGQFDGDRSEILIQATDFRRSGDGNDAGLLCERPCESAIPFFPPYPRRRRPF
jgi:hypothetical protein